MNKYNVTVEISKKSNIKYEYDIQKKRYIIDRILYSSNVYPHNYGYIEKTLDFDGDPLDALIISNEAFLPGALVPTRILGSLEMIDDGEVDTKLITIIDCDPRFHKINKLDDLSPHILKEIKNFFETYKLLQNKKVICKKYLNLNITKEIIKECQSLYQKYLSIINDQKKLKIAIKRDYPNKVNIN